MNRIFRLVFGGGGLKVWFFFRGMRNFKLGEYVFFHLLYPVFFTSMCFRWKQSYIHYIFILPVQIG